LALGAGNALDIALGVHVLRTRLDFAPRLERLRDVVSLTATVGLVCAPISATVGVTTLWLVGQVGLDQYVSTWLSWWLANMIGQILLVPPLLAWSAPSLSHTPRPRLLDVLATTALLVAVTQLAFGRWADLGLYHPALLFGIFPLLIWTGIRFGPREAATAALAVVGMALEATISGLGPLANSAPAERVIYLNIFMAGAALTALGVAALFAERRVLEEERVARARLEGILLATRTVEHELRNQLARTVGWTELLAADRRLPEALRPLAVDALTGARDATHTVEQLRRITQVHETDWGPNLPTTLDLARSAGDEPPSQG
jgi:integral membrane sensor domain MASE1